MRGGRSDAVWDGDAAAVERVLRHTRAAGGMQVDRGRPEAWPPSVFSRFCLTAIGDALSTVRSRTLDAIGGCNAFGKSQNLWNYKSARPVDAGGNIADVLFKELLAQNLTCCALCGKGNGAGGSSSRELMFGEVEVRL